MKMLVRMKLLEDTIFGNGQSIPGEEDISVLCDSKGFPYYKGGTMKGIFREELERLLSWKKCDNAKETVSRLLGTSGSNDSNEKGRLIFSDFCVADCVKKAVSDEIKDPSEIFNAFTSVRTFTKINENGMVKNGSLRVARCVNSGISLFGEIECEDDDSEDVKDLIKEVLSQIKWIGTMRNRGFGKVRIELI